MLEATVNTLARWWLFPEQPIGCISLPTFKDPSGLGLINVYVTSPHVCGLWSCNTTLITNTEHSSFTLFPGISDCFRGMGKYQNLHVTDGKTGVPRS